MTSRIGGGDGVRGGDDAETGPAHGHTDGIDGRPTKPFADARLRPLQNARAEPDGRASFERSRTADIARINGHLSARAISAKYLADLLEILGRDTPVRKGDSVSIRNLPDSHKSELLKVLAGRIPGLPKSERAPAFEAIVKAIQALPVEQDRFEPLLGLVGSIYDLPPGKHEAALRAAFDAVVSLPPTLQAEPLTALAECMSSFAAGEQRLTADAFRNIFRDLFDAVTALPQQQVQPLTELAVNTRYLSSADERLAACQRTLDAVIRLPRDRQIKPLNALIFCVPGLPPGEPWMAIFKALVDAVTQLPPEHQAGPLTALVHRLVDLRTPGHKMMAWRLAYRAITRLPREHQARPMTVLANNVLRFASTEEKTAAFADVLGAARQLSPVDQVEPLTALATCLADVPGSRAEKAAQFRDLLDAMTRLPPELQAEPLIALATCSRYLPGKAQREDAFQDARAALEDLLPEAYVGASVLSRLIEIKDRLP